MNSETYLDGTVRLYAGDSLEILRSLEDSSIDAVVCDPPYFLDLMGHAWDGKDIEAFGTAESESGGPAFFQWSQVWARECLRILKPGAHLLAFGATKTQHWLTAAIEVSGFEIRDQIHWVFGTGMPKTQKALDSGSTGAREGNLIASALKPGYEPIIVARKPLEAAFGANVEKYGTGGLRIDACREATTDSLGGGVVSSKAAGWDRPWKSDPAAIAKTKERGARAVARAEELGRWPANLVLSSQIVSDVDAGAGREVSRFFPVMRYVNKPGADERPEVEGVEHPTVKPVELMRWLCRLVTPVHGVVLDPFAGSGTTGEAAFLEGLSAVLIEREETYLPLIRHRLSKPLQQGIPGLDLTF